MYEFHGIKWLNDDELDPDSPERRGPGWAHAYVPVIGPEGEASATAHVPIYMPRIYKELKRFALQIYKAAGGTTGNVEFSGWWGDVKKGFKKMVKVVAKNKVLRTIAQKGLEAAIPGGAGLSEGALKVAEDLVAKYRGGQKEAAGQIKGFLEQANKGDETATKVVDALRREYVKQQAAGLPALLQTMASGDVVVYDPIVGAKRKMSKKQQKKTNTQRMQALAQQRQKQKQQQQQGRGQSKSRSPLRNSPQGPVAPGTRAQQLRQGMTPGALTPGALRPGMLKPSAFRPGMSPSYPGMMQPNYPGAQYPGMQYPGMQYPAGYPQPYPGEYSPASYGPQGYGSPDEGSYYDPEQDAQDEADLQAAAEENMARMYSPEELEAAEDETAMAGGEYYDIGAKKLKLSADEQRAYAKLSPQERERVKKLGVDEAHRFLASRGQAMQRGKESKQRGQAQKAQDTIKAMRQGQIVRAQKAKLMKEAQRRIQVEKDARHQDRDRYQAQLRALQGQLHDRDLEDDARERLESQADEYEQLLAKTDDRLRELELQQARAAAPQPPARPAPPFVYDEERGEEIDPNDPLVREALAVQQQAAEADEQLEE